MAELFPFRPKSNHTVNPYHLISKLFLNGFYDHRPNILSGVENPLEILTYPPIGLDGGILLSTQDVQNIDSEIVRNYLKRRTMRTGRVAAVTHNGDNIKQLHHSKGDLLTSRGIPYYDANVRFNDSGREARRQVLRRNLYENRFLIENWDEVFQAVNNLTPESKWRISNTIFQNIANDLVALDYALSLAQAKDTSLSLDSSMASQLIFNAVQLYYENLLGLNIEHGNQVMRISEINKIAPFLLDEIHSHSDDELDDTRSRRETDATFLTLTAAQSFISEFSLVEPTVILPKLGSYDIGPALRALGYKGVLHYVLPAYKKEGLVSERGETFLRQASVEQDIKIPGHASKNGINVLFDDSLASGYTLMNIYNKCSARGYQISAIRTMFVNSSPENGSKSVRAEFEEKFGDITQSYFETPIINAEGEKSFRQFLIPRVFSAKWIELAKQKKFQN